MRLDGVSPGRTGGWAGGMNGHMGDREAGLLGWIMSLDLWGFSRWACLLGRRVESPGMKPRV